MPTQPVAQAGGQPGAEAQQPGHRQASAAATGHLDLGAIRDFNFTIGDTDLVGGIDRIKVTLCTQYSDSDEPVCSSPENHSRY
ncbi:hypothetical protein J7E95_39320 [Streptomyces sp. ISL-14]|nr:hypothetical protein [Streptomyces sp. ISL-14]